MSLIRILPETVSNQIAAGEVVDRPASVIKELIENAIDAKAGKISVIIENAGKKLISVIDDGCGMDCDDAILCLEAHATSKIKVESDINNICTMGFRGEALPSIASISRLRLRTKQTDMIEGTEVLVHGGRFISETPIGCAPGTEIRIADLFFNIPARKKFLKSNTTEEKHIYSTFTLLALANPNITFELKIDGKVTVSSPGEKSLLSRLRLLLGKDLVHSSVSVDYEHSGVHVHGYVSKPGYVRNNRREQRIFINGRPIKTNIAFSAIRDAYNTRIMKGTYPVITLFIEINPIEVDINVHPAKHEARFKNERLISSVIYQGITNSLQLSIKPVATAVSTQKIPLNSILQGAEVSYTTAEEKTIENEPLPLINQYFSSTKNIDESVPPVLNKQQNRNNVNQPHNVLRSELDTKPNIKAELTLPGSGIIKVIGLLDDTYILATSDIGLIVIDQHAAHERILFEKLLNENSVKSHSQKLLLPITIHLTRTESNIIKKYNTIFYKLGFEIEPFGDNTVLITAIPPDFPMDNISSLISDLLDDIINSNDSKHNRVNEASIASSACRLAVKAHDSLSLSETEELLRTLSQCNLPFTCPHGRPTVINISLKELEKRFGRKL